MERTEDGRSREKEGKRFNEKNTAWQQDDELSDEEKFQLDLDMATE